jgi:hypothetical protein
VIHPSFPQVDKEYFGQFLLNPHINTYPRNAPGEKQPDIITPKKT